jgi:hypothetical protein
VSGERGDGSQKSEEEHEPLVGLAGSVVTTFGFSDATGGWGEARREVKRVKAGGWKLAADI